MLVFIINVDNFRDLYNNVIKVENISGVNKMEILYFLILILLEDSEIIEKYAGIIILIVIIGFAWIKVINPQIQEYKRKHRLKFNEYGDFEKIEQHYAENEQLENEVEITRKKHFIGDKEKQILESVPITSILEEDNSFDAELFKKWSRNIFTYLQLGKEEDLRQIKASISDEFFDRRMQLLRDFERDNIELKRDDLLIEELKIFDYSKWMDKAQIKIYIKARLREYIINKETQEVLRGNSRKSSERGFILTFQKKDTNKQVGFVNNCPSCGASIADTEFGTCQYCGSLVNPIRYNWTLIKYEVL